MISTKGRYALRVLVDLAEQGPGGPVPLKDVARRQQLSENYLQRVAKLLVSHGMLAGSGGRGGGYRLTREPGEYVVLDVLEAAEGTLAPVACLTEGAPACERASFCKTLPLWSGYYESVRSYFGGVTVADLVEGRLRME